MIEIKVTSKAGEVCKWSCNSLEIRGILIIATTKNDPIQAIINLKNVEKVEVLSV